MSKKTFVELIYRLRDMQYTKNEIEKKIQKAICPCSNRIQNVALLTVISDEPYMKKTERFFCEKCLNYRYELFKAISCERHAIAM